MTNKNRYFIVSYKCMMWRDNITSWEAITTKGSYVNWKEIEEYWFKNQNKTNMVVSNIIELNESDYNDFIK